MDRLISYIRETRHELRHVSWPTREQTIRYTIIVIIVSLAVAGFLGFFDFLFTEGLNRFIL